jgi:hypothetical protein
LTELAAEAIRLRSIPVYVGPFTPSDAPRTFERLVWHIAKAVKRVAMYEEVDVPLHALRILANDCVAAQDAEHLSESGLYGALSAEEWQPVNDPASVAAAVTKDLYDLRDRVAAMRPEIFSDSARPLLLLDDVHLYGRHGLETFLGLLGPGGVSPSKRPVPVALFGKDDEGEGGWVLTRWRNDGRLNRSYHRPLELKPIADVGEEESRVAVLTWLLNPPPPPDGAGQIAVPASLTGSQEMWHSVARMSLRDTFYSPRGFRDYVTEGIKFGYLVLGNDDAALLAAETGGGQ